MNSKASVTSSSTLKGQWRIKKVFPITDKLCPCLRFGVCSPGIKPATSHGGVRYYTVKTTCLNRDQIVGFKCVSVCICQHSLLPVCENRRWDTLWWRKTVCVCVLMFVCVYSCWLVSTHTSQGCSATRPSSSADGCGLHGLMGVSKHHKAWS